VRFVGHYRDADLAELLADTDLAVLPFVANPQGLQEGLGLVAVEAMGCGVPTIAGDVPAIHDVIVHGRNGWLVAGADAAAIGKAVLQLLADPALLQRLGTQARQDVLARFDWSLVTDGYRRLLTGEPLNDAPR
jgi:glycosyltransferase involved in cell wall biosynthesis